MRVFIADVGYQLCELYRQRPRSDLSSFCLGLYSRGQDCEQVGVRDESGDGSEVASLSRVGGATVEERVERPEAVCPLLGVRAGLVDEVAGGVRFVRLEARQQGSDERALALML
jgi:hypothetical protein